MRRLVAPQPAPDGLIVLCESISTTYLEASFLSTSLVHNAVGGVGGGMNK